MSKRDVDQSMRLRVVKLGGSLLVRPDLVSAVNVWQSRQTPANQLVVIGGGKAIDAMRELDQLRRLDPVTTHWRCVEMLDATFDVGCQWFPGWQRIESSDDLTNVIAATRSADQQATARWLVRIAAYYRRGAVESGAESPPENWATTTDTLAALLATRVNADELVILKSCPVPNADIHALAQQGILDEAFPRFAESIPSVRVELL